MNNFGFGSDPFSKSSGEIMRQQATIAQAQLPPDPDKTPQGEISGALGSLAGVMKGQKGARDVLGAVRKGQQQVKQGVSAVKGAMQSGGKDGADNLMDHLKANPPDAGFNNAQQVGGQEGSIARPTPGRPGTGAGSDIPDPDGATAGRALASGGDDVIAGLGVPITGTRGQNIGRLGEEGDDLLGDNAGGVGSTLRSLGTTSNLPKLNVANTLNNTVGGGAAATSGADDAVTSGLSNLHAQVQGMGDKLASVGSKVDAGLDAGIGTAEGVLDALGPVGDFFGAIAGIFGAVKAHKDKVEEEAHNTQEKTAIAGATAQGNTNNTLATGVGRMGNTPTGNMAQQAISSHF